MMGKEEPSDDEKYDDVAFYINMGLSIVALLMALGLILLTLLKWKRWDWFI